MSLPRSFLLVACAAFVPCLSVRGEPPQKNAVVRTDRYGDPLPPGARVRFGTARLRHPGEIIAICISPDGKKLACAATNRTEESVSVVLSDARTGKQLRSFSGSGPALAFSPDGSVLALNDKDGIRLWDIERARDIRRLTGPEADAYSLAFTPDGHTLVAGRFDRPVRLWDVRTGKLVPAWANHKGTNGRAVLSPDGKFLTATKDGDPPAVRLWNLATARMIRPLGHPYMRPVSLSFAADGKTLAAACLADSVYLVDVATGRDLCQPLRVSSVHSAAFSPDGKLLAGAGGDGIVLWDAATRQEVGSLPARSVESMSFTANGKFLATAHHVFFSRIQLWDVATNAELYPTPGHQGQVLGVEFSPDGNLLATGSMDHTIRLWDAATGREVRALTGHEDDVQKVAFSPDGKVLASAGWDESARLWDVSTGKLLRTLETGRFTESVAFSPDGKFLATGGSEQPIMLWEVASGRRIRSFGGDRDSSLCFSSDGKRLASSTGVWDTATGKELWKTPQWMETVSLSPDGKLLATGDREKLVCVWDARTGKLLRRCVGHEHTLRAVTFSPDGTAIVSAGFDHTIRLWDVRTGKELRRWTLPCGFKSVAFAPSGKAVALGCVDGTTLLWDIREKDPAPKSRELAREERELLWEDLLTDPMPKARGTIWSLAAAPQQAVPYLAGRLKPVTTLDPTRLAQLVRDLENKRFAVREKATRELEGLGEMAESSLRKALQGGPSLELRRRVDNLLERVETQRRSPPPEELRALRAVEALEFADTPEARRVLERLAEGAADARLTKEAKAALQHQLRRGW